MRVKRNTYKPGDWKVYCPVCSGFRYASSLKPRWDGLKVCPECWEPRHPQEFVRGVSDEVSVPFTYKDPERDVTAVSINRDTSDVRNSSGSPSGVLTPLWENEEVYDVVNGTWYKANGLTNTSWETI